MHILTKLNSQLTICFDFIQTLYLYRMLAIHIWSETFGKCRKGECCNYVKGSCLKGCDVWVYSEKCDFGMLNNV